jgi:hypothetical protein
MRRRYKSLNIKANKRAVMGCVAQRCVVSLIRATFLTFPGLSDLGQASGCFLVTEAGRLGEELPGLIAILGYALAILIHRAQIVHCGRIARRSGLTKPLRGTSKVLLNSVA